MVYITKEYYEQEFGGASIENAAFSSLVKRASRDINRITLHKIERIGFNNLDDYSKELVKEATAIQVEYLEANGMDATTQGIVSQGFSIGNYSENGANGGCGLAYPFTVHELLIEAGLLSGVVDSLDNTCIGGDWI